MSESALGFVTIDRPINKPTAKAARPTRAPCCKRTVNRYTAAIAITIPSRSLETEPLSANRCGFSPTSAAVKGA
jgi:hypothetical protein